MQLHRAVHPRRACAARPMHVVSTSMSRRDLNFPTLSAPYRTPCLPPPSPARAATAVAPPRLLDAPHFPPPFPSLGEHAVRALHLPARSRIPVTTNTHVRIPRLWPNGQRSYARATAHDFSSMRPDLLRSPLPSLSSPSSRGKLAAARPVARASFSGRNAEITNLAIRLILFHFFRSTGRSILLFSVGKGTDVFFNSEVIV